jgi:hypothetical protein
MVLILPDVRKTSGDRLNLCGARHELPDVSRFPITCRAGVLSAATAAAVVLGAVGPALADVTVDPPSAPQGGGANLTFRVTNTDPTAITRVTLLLPADSPIAEVYPLSVDDWAPLIVNRALQTPLATIHGGTPATETAASITWIAMPGSALAPGRSADLSVAVGPLPTLSSIQFTLQATHADGTPAVAMPPATLALTPATAADQATQAAEHAGHGATDPTAGGTSADDFPWAAIVAPADQGPSGWAISGWILAALAAAAALVSLRRGRRRAAAAAQAADEPRTDEPTADEPPADESRVDESPGDESSADDPPGDPPDGAKEPIGAGAGKVRASGWRYQEPE